MKSQRFILLLLALTFALAPQSLKTAFAEGHRGGGYRAKLISPKVGAVLMPGTIVRIEWTAVFPDVDLTMCETEIMLSVDGGETFTFVTSQRNPTVQFFDWLVPRSPTKAAMLDIRFGCLGLYPETASPQVQSTFVISSMD
jgi:hypothetical protein